jgi:hypothetical protein
MTAMIWKLRQVGYVRNLASRAGYSLGCDGRAIVKR